jgi:glutaminyl-peptide cyclotransferase
MKRKLFASIIVVLLIVSLVASMIPFSCKGDSPDGPSTETPIPTTPPPPVLGYSNMATYPHDTSFYTQGYTFYKGELYEGTGDPTRMGKSRLMKVDLKTGKALKQISLSNEFFGEGITILRDTIYQLTWQEHKVFVYTLKDFTKVKTYNLPTEGWGITNDGTKLIVSIGNGVLNYYDPSTFTLLSKISITEGGNDAYNLNELEYIDGYIYANQYTTPYILKIDPNSGRVVGKYDLTKEINKIKELKPDADVLNGIAYDETTKKIYVTGKYWPEAYEIKFGQ